MKAAPTLSVVPSAGLLLLVFFVIGGLAQQQTTFGSEMEIDRKEKIPPSFIQLLDKSDRRQLNKCQHNVDYPELRKSNLLDHFLVSALSVRNVKSRLDLLVVQANSICFWGAHNTKFWILSKEKSESAKNYKKIFEGQMDGLNISDRTSQIYPNLEIMNHTAIEFYKSTLRYSGGRYKVQSCYVENMGDDSPNRPKMKVQ
ncbi:MAG: hypothetical protein ABIP78_01795 [Pyrinomonadaceae bacterium]